MPSTLQEIQLNRLAASHAAIETQSATVAGSLGLTNRLHFFARL